jgi:hypothetical protein
MRILLPTATVGNILCLTRNEQACGLSSLVGSPQIAHLWLELETGKGPVSAGTGSPDTARFWHETLGRPGAQLLPKVGINTTKGSEVEELDMDERISCSVCRHENPPENRYCGSCGTELADSGQLVPRRDHSPAATVRALPAKLGPSGKALAVGLAALAAEAGLLWLRRRVERADPTPLPAAVQYSRSPVSKYILSQSLEEVSVWLQAGDSRSHIFARREVRSFDYLKPPDGRG